MRHLGRDCGRQGLKDEAIIPLLHQLAPVTFFTRDLGFYRRTLCHPEYCLVCLAVGQYETASFIRRFMKCPGFKSRSERMGKVVRVTHTGLQTWNFNADSERRSAWPT
ncbi:MAG: hypothetical protein HYU64_16435 [Armatimonadetes bacterium]|nr:hypothetical protein [Armatimonadota bacterium]